MLPVWKWNHQIILWTASVTSHSTWHWYMWWRLHAQGFLNAVLLVCISCAERKREGVKDCYHPYHLDVSGDCCVHDSVIGRTTVLAELSLRSVLHQIGRHCVQVYPTGALRCNWIFRVVCTWCFCQLAGVASCCFLPTTGVWPQNRSSRNLDCSLHTHGIAGIPEGEPRVLLMSEVNLLTVCDNIMFMKHWKYEASIWLHGKGQNNDIV